MINMIPSAEIIVEISNDPISGFKRKTILSNFTWDAINKSIVTRTETYYFNCNEDNSYGDIIDSARFAPYSTVLVANNNNIVDENGDIVLPENQIEGQTYYGEYDYYVMAASQAIIIFDLIRTSIEKADESGRFN